jgi:(heptosyl)LPS beta-1,4-glucosyltransferase
MRTKVSVVIIARNEENLIARCILSVKWADEILLLDSNSSDQTREIARELGAKVHTHDFDGFPQQKNRAISLAANDWVFFLEADEIVTPMLAGSICKILSGPIDPNDGYYPIRRADCLGELVESDMRRSKQRTMIRLFNRNVHKFPVEFAVHEEVYVKGKAIRLDGVLLHWRGMTIDQAVASINKYASIEANILFKKGKRSTPAVFVGRPVARFLWFYIGKRQFLHGTPGFVYCFFKFANEFLRYAKLWELENGPGGIHPPDNIYRQD